MSVQRSGTDITPARAPRSTTITISNPGRHQPQIRIPRKFSAKETPSPVPSQPAAREAGSRSGSAADGPKAPGTGAA